ncbi:Uncharacterised protein [Nocardia otitidiscaviarum]|uniref:DUF5753 domain-containing protein n=2 Tax=Nocardia otitidiscaviarum TaxID=1823 RepID=A0A378YVN6_9NOCA|nr:Uncharacterised protein [Nocardia otitidiscaviarum]
MGGGDVADLGVGQNDSAGGGQLDDRVVDSHPDGENIRVEVSGSCRTCRFGSCHTVWGSYLGLIAQSFILLEFPPLQQRGLVEPPIVFVELREGSLFLEETAVIERYRAAIADISRVALDETASRRLVLDLAKEM